MNWKSWAKQLAPHWAVMLVGILAAFTLFETFVTALTTWSALAIVFVIAFGYPMVAVRLGFAPPVWTSQLPDEE